ncbi:MAG TPA: alpha/beta hydrolase [Euzebyales bacterium]|nr:alpha/beta hydrolase [Euzebyales bacterium]
MNTAPIVLVPGFWLGAWAWDEVAAALRADGHDVTALTLPGLESADADRSSITLADHVDAICEAVTVAGRPVVLAVHSGTGAPAMRSPTACRSGSRRWSTSTPARRRAHSTLAELRDVTYVDLPTSHWPMWSRPQELAAVIGDVAHGASGT